MVEKRGGRQKMVVTSSRKIRSISVLNPSNLFYFGSNQIDKFKFFAIKAYLNVLH